jgi:glycosyltransferase involved in cell wall biosynthesis
VPLISVVMPTYDHDAWLPAAVGSLLAQTVTDWECVVVDDGSPGNTASALGEALDDPRVRLEVLPRNGGLGAALNRGLDLTTAPYVAYLPSDDAWHAEHLETLLAALEADPEAGLAVAGVRHGQGLTATDSPGRISGEPLQLVQVAHGRTDDRWVERSELTTDDLGRMLWDRLAERGSTVHTGRVTCEWSWHPRQRHKVLREPWGGLNAYRTRYRVQEPLRLQSTVGSLHDEGEHYRRYRERPAVPRAADGLRILLVGELAHNPERVLALSERGHELHGLWTQDPVWFNTVGRCRSATSPRSRATTGARPCASCSRTSSTRCSTGRRSRSRTRCSGGPRRAVRLARQGGAVLLAAARATGRSWSTCTPAPTGRSTPASSCATGSPRACPAAATACRSSWTATCPRPRRSRRRALAAAVGATGDVHTVIPGRPDGPAAGVRRRAGAPRGAPAPLRQKAAAQMRDWVEEVQRLAPGPPAPAPAGRPRAVGQRVLAVRRGLAARRAQPQPR